MADPGDKSVPFYKTAWFQIIAVAAIGVAGWQLYKRAQVPPQVKDNIGAVSAALIAGETTLVDLPACEPMDATCLDKVATYMGSTSGFHPERPTQAACATVAVIVARDKRGDLVPDSNAWLGMLKVGKGAGPDALRVAVARAMADHAADVGVHCEDETCAKKLMAAVAASIPGACDTYGEIGRGTALEGMPAETHPDHSACVQRDLSRRDGPGGRYGTGIFRAAEGAAALWREEERMLRIGTPSASPAVQKIITEKLAITEPLTLKIDLKKVSSADEATIVNLLSDVHADAGIMLYKRDGGVPEGGTHVEIPRRH